MKKPTIYQIKQATSESSPYFFSTKTLRFFNQKLTDFKVEKTSDPNIFYLWAWCKNSNGEKTFKTERFFNIKTGELLRELF